MSTLSSTMHSGALQGVFLIIPMACGVQKRMNVMLSEAHSMMCMKHGGICVLSRERKDGRADS